MRGVFVLAMAVCVLAAASDPMEAALSQGGAWTWVVGVGSALAAGWLAHEGIEELRR